MLSRVTVCVAISALLLSSSALSVQGAATASLPPTAIERLEQSQAALREARARSDWAAYLVAARQMKELLNGSPQSRLESARAEIRAGHADAALEELAAYARMGQSSEVLEKLPDFESLRQRKEFEAVRASMANNRQPVARSAIAFHIPDKGLLPEDIDFDPRSKRFLISSVLQHRIVATAGDGVLAEFARAPEDWPMMALKIDAKRNVVWATEVAMEGFSVVAKSDQGRSAVLCYDLTTGKLLRRIEGPRPSTLGDMALTAKGGIIVSDGAHGGLYRLEAGNEQLQRLDHGEFISPQTVVISSDAAHAYVPDYVRGLGIFDLKTSHTTWLPMSARFALDGIDGLYRVGKQLIAVQNGTSPQRVILFSMNSTATRIVSEQIIERATATLGSPTHGVIVDDAFYYIGNSGWDALGDDGVIAPNATMTESVIMKWKFP